jgi:two-component sensor histidine kinase
MLQVCDNGKGLPPDFLNGEKGSLGTTLIQQLSKQLDATLDLKNEDGSFIELRFKKNNKTGSSSQQFNFS